MIQRYSSRRRSLAGFLPERLRGARAYDRIAGYFSSSILEVAGEALDELAPGAVVRVVCNSQIEPLDALTARAAKQAMYREWCRSLPEDISPALKARLEQLYRFLSTGRLRVKVLPDQHFGLIHGKAGVVARADGRPCCFIGSANESRTAWALNYELVWVDESAEGVRWVQEEFDALWGHPAAVDLAEAVVQDVDRLARREVMAEVGGWRTAPEPDPAAPLVELPVYRRENGLWAHQKSFVQLAFDQHRRGGARLVLADQVGLGKTIQLALAARLMALWGGGPVLVLAPKALLWQWQGELWSMLELPSAVWTGDAWRDEAGVEHPARGIEDLRRCPRRVGIVSTGLVVQSPIAAETLAGLSYECVVLDEAHRARRHNLGPTHRDERADPNNLLDFLRTVAPRTRSLLLATATPVQLDPIEAWDLLDALNRTPGDDGRVLGSSFSRWRTRPREGIAYVLGEEPPPGDLREVWEWLRDPFPPSDEGRDFRNLRRDLHLAGDLTGDLTGDRPGDRPDTVAWVRPEALDRLRPAARDRLRDVGRDFFGKHNPFIRFIVRRTREYLETTLDPRTGEPYLRPVRVRLFGERPEEAVPLPTFLRDAYQAAEDFCDLLRRRPGLSSAFLKTILLRRVGSTVEAGRQTALKMLRHGVADQESDGGEGEDNDDNDDESPLYPLAEAERAELGRFLGLLEANREEDPKAREVIRLLREGCEGTRSWLEIGCIVFTQYADSARWLGERLSREWPGEPVALYAGGSRSGLWRNGSFTRLARETIKAGVQSGAYRLVVGTDAASEGLNLQRLGSLINLDLPWNPTRLEQRKGRIQRIGQLRDEVFIHNLRYRGSVEDRVHELLSSRLEAIRNLFGQLPDTLEDVWVQVALREEAAAREVIAQVPTAHPFAIRYDRIEAIDWESCSRVLDSQSQLEVLRRGW